MKLHALLADITTLELDAIVNAANPRLAGGGGVDGAIHRAAGPELLTACLALGGCPTGEARLTPGFALPARCVIHTVGPVWQGGAHGEDALLARCYGESLHLANTHGLARIAFPGISTGVYGFPPARAARIALAAVRAEAGRCPAVAEVIFCCFSADDLALYESLL